MLASKPHLILRSAGIKTPAFPALWAPKEADLLIDCRVVKDPSHYVPGGGTSLEVQEWLLQNSSGALFQIYYLVGEGIEMIPERRKEKEDPYKDPFKILFFCAHGLHRSPATKHIIGRWLREDGYEVSIE